MLAILPCLMLTAYWTAGEVALLLASVTVPGIFALAGALGVSAETLAAGRDPVTGLPGPEAGTDATDRLIARNPSGALTTAVLSLEVDDFSVLRDQHGPGAADNILKAVAERLQSHVRASDLLVRLDGPAFALFLQTAARNDMDALLELAERLQEAFSSAVSLNGKRVYVTLSVGICPPSRSPGRTGADTLDAARIALDTARQGGAGSIRVYAGEMGRFRTQRSDLVADLAHAFERGEMRFSFQPLVALEGNTLDGVEMLVRWHHKRHGVLTPPEFLNEINQLGLSKTLEDLCIRDALAAIRDWHAAGLAVPWISINLSMDSLADPEFAERVRWQLDRFEVPGHRLGLDILASTDQAAQDENVLRNLKALRASGLTLTLDDFGGPKLSVETAQALQVSGAKIARCRIARLDRDPKQRALAEGLIRLANSLELPITAMGVETAGEADVLAKIGCQTIQGYLVAHPMPLSEMTTWIAQHSGTNPAEREGRETPSGEEQQGKTA
jgi:diguanylate cyclase (GGDEF)-like protein